MKINYSGSPHAKSPRTTKGIMIDVLIALAPATIMSGVLFGFKAIIICLLALIGVVGGEIVFKFAFKKDIKAIIAEFDYTSAVTGLLLGLNMPPIDLTNYWYVPLISGIFAIVVVKMLFGGTGCNIVNPAIAGRVFALMSFSLVMTQSYVLPNINALSGNVVTTGATPLTAILTNAAGSGAVYNMNLTNVDLLLGLGIGGCIGETCKAAIILGGVYLVVKGVINPLYPIIYLVTTGLFTVCLFDFNIYYFLPSVLSGGVMLGAVFMATDYVTSPKSKWGNIIYFFFLGLLTAGLRKACSMEVTSFAIMLGNLIVPLIDKFIFPKPFGYVKPQKGGKA